MTSTPRSAVYPLGMAGALLSVVVLCDLALEPFCARTSVLAYLLAIAFGVLVGRLCQGWLASERLLAKVVRAACLVLTVGALGGVAVLVTQAPRWDTKCSWRYCGRALGVRLLKSPFPVGTPSCQAWHVCANEYPYSTSEYDVMLDRMAQQGCAAP